MKHLILAMLLLFTTATANAQLTADAAYGVSYTPTELRLSYLPQDADKQYVTIFGTGERFEQAKAWFDSNAELKRLKDSSHFAAIDTTSPMFGRYRSCTPHPLTIRIQQADGTIIHESNDLPLSSEAFIRQTNECFRRRQPPPADPEPQPLTPPPSPPAKRQSPAWPAVTIAATLAAIVGGFFGVRSKWKETHL
jgi:hypothetical protein